VPWPSDRFVVSICDIKSRILKSGERLIAARFWWAYAPTLLLQKVGIISICRKIAARSRKGKPREFAFHRLAEKYFWLLRTPKKKFAENYATPKKNSTKNPTCEQKFSCVDKSLAIDWNAKIKIDYKKYLSHN